LAGGADSAVAGESPADYAPLALGRRRRGRRDSDD
jgi:hypothetical protein